MYSSCICTIVKMFLLLGPLKGHFLKYALSWQYLARPWIQDRPVPSLYRAQWPTTLPGRLMANTFAQSVSCSVYDNRLKPFLGLSDNASSHKQLYLKINPADPFRNLKCVQSFVNVQQACVVFFRVLHIFLNGN